MIRVGLLGYGCWGPHLARNLRAHPEVVLAAVCDPDPGRRAAARRECQPARVAARASDLLAERSLDAVAIATPASSHFPLALAALAAGLHVFVEKPLATSVDDAARLVDVAHRRRLVLMVDHTYLFTPALRHLTRLVEAGDLGALRWYDSARIARGRLRSDVNVLWDLAAHDLAVLDRLTGEVPLAVAAHGAAHAPGHREDMAFVTVRHAGGLLAHLHLNWLAPFKLRRTLVGGTRRTVLWDDLEPSEKLRVFDTPAAVDLVPTAAATAMTIAHAPGEVFAPRLETYEPLAAAVAELVRAVASGSRPASDGETGLRIVRVLAAADQSLRLGGAPVEVGEGPRRALGAPRRRPAPAPAPAPAPR